LAVKHEDNILSRFTPTTSDTSLHSRISTAGRNISTRNPVKSSFRKYCLRTDGLFVRRPMPAAYVSVFNTIIVESVIELCENGPRRCLHCNGVSSLACDRVAVTKDCHHSDVSRQTLFCYISLSRLHSPCFIAAVRIDVGLIRPFVKHMLYFK